MPKFGEKSLTELNTCHEYIVKVCEEIVKVFDCSVLCGSRGASMQMSGFRKGRTKLPYPLSKHNPFLDEEGWLRLAHTLSCGSKKKDIIQAVKQADEEILCNIDAVMGKDYKSLAVDIVPYPVNWEYWEEMKYCSFYGYKAVEDFARPKAIFNNACRWHEFAGRMLGVADNMGVKMSWGGHWRNFKDLPHFQISV